MGHFPNQMRYFIILNTSKCVLFDFESVQFEMESVLFGVESVRCGLESILIKVEMVYFNSSGNEF